MCAQSDSPSAGDPFPEIAWGDHFFYFAPDGKVPERTQPFTTIVTKNYPNDTASGLDRPGRWRINVHVGRKRIIAAVGDDAIPNAPADDTIQPHPLFGGQGWIAVVNPGRRTEQALAQLIAAAHEDARRRWESARKR